MAKITYLGEDENSNAPVTWHGKVLKPGESVDVNWDRSRLDKAEGNPFFKVEGADDVPDDSTPYGRGWIAKGAGKTRSVPVAYRGKVEGTEWQKGFDDAPEAAKPVETGADGGVMSTGAMPGVPLAP